MIDRLRDHVEKGAPGAGLDPELVEAYRMVVAATDDPAPACGTRFADLRIAPRGHRWRRPLAAAAILLAVVLPFLRPAEPPRPAVRLAAIPLMPLEPPAPPELPEGLLGYRPAEAGRVHWLDLDDARAYARAVGRPVFLFVHYPGCPLCERLDRVQFRDDRVLEALQGVVPARVAYPDVPPELQAPVESWPIFLFLDGDGRRTSGFSGMRSASGFVAALHEAAPEAFDWTLAAPSPADPAARYAAWLDVERRDPGGAFGRAARAARLALVAEARAALLAARDAPPAEAKRLLGDFLPRVRGTPPGDDLARVLRHLETYGAFPRLENDS